MNRPNPRQRLRGLIRSRALTASLLVVAVAVAVALGREIGRRVAVQREIDRLARDISQQQRSTDDLEQLIASLKSATFQEGAARSELNLQRPGEHVIVVPHSNVNGQAAVETPGEPSNPTGDSSRPNARRWWDFLFHGKNGGSS